MSRRFFWVGVFVPLFLAGCSSEQPSNHTQLGDISNQSNDVAGDTSPLVQQDENLAYIETFPAEGQRKSLSTYPSSTSELTLAHQRFAFSDYAAHSSTDVNIVASPFDLQQLLAMVALGAEGTTIHALSNAAGFNFAEGEIHTAVSDWEQHINGLGLIERQSFLWGQERYPFSQQYLQNQAEFFGPYMTALDFQAAEDIAAIAINEGLAGRLELPEIDSRSRLVAAQSSQSDIGWSPSLSVQAVKGRFAVLQDYEQRWVDMVLIEGLMNVIEEEGFAVVEIPLAEDELSLLIITPALGLFDEIRSRFDEEFLREQLEKLAPAQASIMVPQFEIVRELSENEMLDLGVALLDPAPKTLVLDSDDGAMQWTVNEDGQAVVLTEDVEVDPDNVANFFHVNAAGYLYVLPPLQAIDFSVGEDGVVASSVSAIVHEASVSEPGWLIGSFPEQGGGSFSGNLISTLGPNENRCFYPPDQSRFFFALFARETGTLLHLGHVVTLNGEIVTPDWTTFFNCGDSPPVEIYQYTGAILCESNGVSLQHAKESLVNEGIDVLQWGSANDGLVSSNLCGVSSGDLNLFTIRNSDLSLAESLGFKRVSELPPEVQLIY